MIESGSTEDLRLLLSLVVIGQQLLVALIFVKGRPMVTARWLGALLVAGFVAYLIQNNPVLMDAAASVRIFIIGMSVAVPYLLWEFSIAIFETVGVPRVARVPIYLVPVALMICVFTDELCPPGTTDILESMHELLGLALIVHIVATVFLDRRDDLLEPRRRYRTLFVLLISIQAGTVLAVELYFGNSTFPDWLQLANVIMIALLTLGLSLPLLALDDRILWQKPINDLATDGLSPQNAMTAANRVLQDALNVLIQDGFYRTRDLQINGLATKLKVPEHQLRKLINQRLGYRNFSAFLNHYRIREAETHLANTEMVRIPVLTIAMDLGYGSIGPFNRAFKEATRLTPTEFRQHKLGNPAPNSE